MLKKIKEDLGFYATVTGIALLIWLAASIYFIANPPRAWIALGVFPALFVAAGVFAGVHAETKVKGLLFGLLTVLALGAVEYLIVFAPPQLFAEVIECTITGDDNAATGGGDKSSTRSKKFIYTDYGENDEPFQNVDAVAFFKTNSLNVQGQAKKLAGKKVRMKVYGLRLSWLSMTRNVIWIEELKAL